MQILIVLETIDVGSAWVTKVREPYEMLDRCAFNKFGNVFFPEREMAEAQVTKESRFSLIVDAWLLKQRQSTLTQWLAPSWIDVVLEAIHNQTKS
jgi:hypothetical protein